MWSDRVASVKMIVQGTREKEKRKAKEKIGGGHQRLDLPRFQQQSESSRGLSEMAEDCRRCVPQFTKLHTPTSRHQRSSSSLWESVPVSL